jgi:hypothetical protein
MAGNNIKYIIKFDLPSEVSKGFPQLKDRMRRHIVRQAIRSALVPAKNSLKAKLVSLPRNSKQSSGATLRALTSKYRNSIRNPDRFYGIIGINRKSFETIIPRNISPPIFHTSAFRQMNWGIKIGRDAEGNIRYAKGHERRDVRSTYKRRLLTPRKRRPIKYLHLWERGYASSHRSFTGHHFIQQAYQQTKEEVLAIFKHRVLSMFREAFMS